MMLNQNNDSGIMASSGSNHWQHAPLLKKRKGNIKLWLKGFMLFILNKMEIMFEIQNHLK